MVRHVYIAHVPVGSYRILSNFYLLDLHAKFVVGPNIAWSDDLRACKPKCLQIEQLLERQGFFEGDWTPLTRSIWTRVGRLFWTPLVCRAKRVSKEGRRYGSGESRLFLPRKGHHRD